MSSANNYPSSEGARLGALIKDLGISQRRFAATVGYSQASINNMVRGETRITREAAERICDTYKVRIGWLLKGEGPRFRPTEALPFETKTLAPTTTTTTDAGAPEKAVAVRRTEPVKIWVCSNCKKGGLERDYIFCPRCGLRLVWPDMHNAED